MMCAAACGPNGARQQSPGPATQERSPGNAPRHVAALKGRLITGSSLVGHEDEALTHDYHLLIKPVLPGKLRAMIAFKLGLRRGGGGGGSGGGGTA